MNYELKTLDSKALRPLYPLRSLREKKSSRGAGFAEE